MGYQVISRKYRPLTFADLTGQEHIARTLKNALENKRLPHAFVFSGVRGTGKTTTARILAKCLNCISGITSTPCLECPSCREIAAGNSLDVIEIDAASNTGVDNVREVIVNNISIAPARDKYKVFIIDEVHMLSTPAFNALLKTLEEPPSHVVFIMATTELHKVPETILSRCQHFEFRQIPIEKIYHRLKEIAVTEGVTISEAALREIARAGHGSLRDAQSAFDQVISFSGAEIGEQDVIGSLGLVGSKILLRTLEGIADQESKALLAVVDEVDNAGYDLRVFSRELMTWLRHLLLIKSGLGGSALEGLLEAEVNTLTALSGRFSEEDLVRFFHLLTETEKQIKDSMQPRFQLEIGLLKLVHAGRLRTLAEIITRLEALEERSRGGGAAPAASAPASGRSVPSTPTRQAAAPAPARDPYEEPAGFRDSFYAGLPPEPEYSASEIPDPVVDPVPLRTIRPGGEVSAIKKELETRKRTLVSVALEEADITYSDGVLTASFPSENAYSKRLQDSTTMLREIGLTLFGQPLKLVVRFSGEQVAAPRDEAHEERLKSFEAARQNPAIKSLLTTLRGEIIDIRPIGDSSTPEERL